jgi:hypothetical protein
METLTLTKGGHLILHEWKDGTYVDRDVTDSAVRRSFDAVQLADDVTLGDLFLLVQRDDEFWDLLVGNWLKEYLEVGLSPLLNPKEETEDDKIEFLELYKTFMVQPDAIHGMENPEFHGIGPVLTKDTQSGKAGERIQYAITFTPANELAKLSLKLKKSLLIYNDDHESNDWGKELFTLDNGVRYTLGEIIYAVFWELSFYGNPEDNTKFKKSVFDIAEEAGVTMTNLAESVEE